MSLPDMRDTTKPPLPGGLEACHALIAELMQTLAVRDRENAYLKAFSERLLARLYGRSSEKLDPNQLHLFGELVNDAAAQPAVEQAAQDEQKAEEAAAPPQKKKGHGRKKQPAELPRIRLEHPVPESECACAQCGKQRKRIGEDIAEQLEYAPASLFIIEHVRPILALSCDCVCGCAGEHQCGCAPIVTAPKPAQPIEKGLPGPGLIAHVVVNKYCDHLPLHRQESILARQGAELSRKTLWGWVLAAANLLEPVAARMKELLLESKVIHTDDTPVDVLDGRGGGKHQGRFWVYLGDTGHPYTLYDYTPSRRRDGPVEFLRGFAGSEKEPRYLQADAFTGYDILFETKANHLLEVACWAHARRKFHDARTSDVVRAHWMLAQIRLLYAIESEAKDLDGGARRALRQDRARPILEEIAQWLETQQPLTLPKSPIGEAIVYARNQWTALLRYLDDGELDIDNNPAENVLRGIAVGRNNWLFCGSDRGGRAAAVHYSLIVSAKRHGIDPFFYLRDLFIRIPTHPDKDIDKLLPDRWKRDILPTLDLRPSAAVLASMGIVAQNKK